MKTTNPYLKRQRAVFRNVNIIFTAFFLAIIGSIAISSQVSTYTRDFTKNRELYNARLDSLAIEKHYYDLLVADLAEFVPNPAEIADSLEALALRLSPDRCIEAEDLAKVIYIESRFDTQAVNYDTRAVGWFQLIPSVIKQFGWDYISIFNSSPLEQLKYAEMYFNFWFSETERIISLRPHLKLWKDGISVRCLSDLYLIIHFPRAFVYQDQILYHVGSKAYQFNMALDYNDDKKVDRTDIMQKMQETPF